MFYGCKFYVADSCAVLTASLVTSAQYEFEGANEALNAYAAYVEDTQEQNENVGFGVIYYDEHECRVHGLMLDDKFLNDESVAEIGLSLQHKFQPASVDA